MHIINSSGAAAIMIEEGEEQFNPDAYIRENTGLVRLLIAVNRAGKRGISTRRVCEQVFNSRSYGLEMLKEAAEKKLITRSDPLPVPKGQRGNLLVVNRITPKGRKLLAKLQL
jgi:hypothetical protein